MTKQLILKQLFIVSIFAVLTVATALAQTTAFNFQGRMNDGANPANGNFEMQFKLYDALTGGNQIGATVSRPNVAVINGIFAAQLDFGAAAFDGSNRFVEIGVRPAGNTNAFNILNPRQAILSAPYAIQAQNAAKLGGIPASEYVTTTTVGNSFIKNATTQQTGNFNINGSGVIGGNLGIGTTTPTSKLQVFGNGYGITQTDGTVTVGSYINPTGGWLGTRTTHPLFFFTNDSLPQMTVDTTGNVGIGTTNPTARLYVLSPVSGTSAIYGESSTGRGVWGKSTTSRGVYGESSSLEGVLGTSVSGVGVLGGSTSNSGVRGETSIASLTAAGVFGKGLAVGSIGVTGESNLGNAVGVYGVSTSPTGFGVFARNTGGGQAFYADGNVAQNLNSNGLVKAMALVRVVRVCGSTTCSTLTPSIVNCYNSVNNSTSGNCGFSLPAVFPNGVDIDFGFQVNNRFIMLTPGIGDNAASVTTFVGTNRLTVANGLFATSEFYIYVF